MTLLDRSGGTELAAALWEDRFCQQASVVHRGYLHAKDGQWYRQHALNGLLPTKPRPASKRSKTKRHFIDVDTASVASVR